MVTSAALIEAFQLGHCYCELNGIYRLWEGQCFNLSMLLLLRRAAVMTYATKVEGVQWL